jgi:hypothetical protein
MDGHKALNRAIPSLVQYPDQATTILALVQPCSKEQAVSCSFC